MSTKDLVHASLMTCASCSCLWRDDLTGFFFGCSRNFSVLIAFLETEVFESVLLHAGFHKPPRKIITDLAPRSCFALSSYPHDVFCRR